jgi:hypothetical protein
MSMQEVAKCADRLQYLYEVLYAIRKVTGRRFQDIEAELTMVLRLLTVYRKSVAFQQVMRLCDKCSSAVDSKMREYPNNLYRRGVLHAGVSPGR